MEDYINEVSDADAEYKIILTGDSTVGKTTLFKKILQNVFLEKSVLTIGIDKKKINLEIKVTEEEKEVLKKISLILEDTAGQERYQALTKTYFKGANGVLLLYNITNKKSFDNLTRWVNLIKENINTNSEVKGYIIFLMGTKSDIANEFPEKREVEEDDAIEFCNKQGLIWKGECSSKNFSDENYKKIFSEFAKELYEKFKSNKSERVTVSTLQKKKTKPHRRNCHC